MTETEENINEMEERVARAICLAELPTDDKWKWCLPPARAAIKAMREPTDHMLSGTDRGIPVKQLVKNYKIMIDGALD